MPTGVLFHRVQTPEPMAIEPMLMRGSGQEVSVSPSSFPCIFGRGLYCFIIPKLYQAWRVFHPMVCKYHIASNREIGKNLALTLLCRPDKLPKLTEKTGYIV